MTTKHAKPLTPEERVAFKHTVSDTGDVYAAPRDAPERPAVELDNGREIWPHVGSAYAPHAPLATEVGRFAGGGLGGSAGPSNGLWSLEAVTGVATGTLPESAVNEDTVKVPLVESGPVVDVTDNNESVSDVPASARDQSEIRDASKQAVDPSEAKVTPKAEAPEGKPAHTEKHTKKG